MWSNYLRAVRKVTTNWSLWVEGGASVTTPLKMNNAKGQLALIRGSNRILRTSASWKNDCCSKINAEFEVHDVMFFTAKQYSVAAVHRKFFIVYRHKRPHLFFGIGAKYFMRSDSIIKKWQNKHAWIRKEWSVFFVQPLWDDQTQYNNLFAQNTVKSFRWLTPNSV